MSESFAELFEESLTRTEMRSGAMIKSVVIDIDNRDVTVGVQSKSEGVIPRRQFLNVDGELEVEIGDEVEVALELFEDGLGRTLLSRDKAKKNKIWKELEQAMENDEIVVGRLSANSRVRGGFTVTVGVLQAFLPGSLADMHAVQDISSLQDRDLEFKVIKIDQKRDNVVLSRRAAMEKEYSKERAALISTLEDGAIVKGLVKNMTDYGAFIDLGGIDGLLHITDIAWSRVRHPSECVKIGEQIKVKVLKFDKEKVRVSLGIKQMSEDPWNDIRQRYSEGDRVQGKVSNITDYGCFVEIEKGIEGLVHISEMDWTNKNVNPAKIVQSGDEAEVMILEIYEERRRISLGMKQCRANPWEEFSANHAKGDKVVGKIKSITDFGIFIGLEGGIDGLVHLSDITWKDNSQEIMRNYKKEDEIEAVILLVDSERERISLGIKQLEKDLLQNYIDLHRKGSMVTGTIKSVDAKGAVVTLDENVEGYLQAHEIQRDRVDDASTLLNEGDKIEAKFIGVDKKTRLISLSIKAKERHEETASLKGYKKENEENYTSATLKDIFKKLDT